MTVLQMKNVKTNILNAVYYDITQYVSYSVCLESSQLIHFSFHIWFIYNSNNNNR